MTSPTLQPPLVLTPAKVPASSALTPMPAPAVSAVGRETAATTTATSTAAPLPAATSSSGGVSAAIWGAGAVVVAALLLGLWNIVLARRKTREEERTRQRTAFAEALQAVAVYKEMPYAVRRRNAESPGEERVRLSEAVRAVQAELTFHQTWIRSESAAVADVYDALVAACRRVAGGAMRDAWKADAIMSDAEMNLGPEVVDLTELTPLQEAFTAAAAAHLQQLTPWWCR